MRKIPILLMLTVATTLSADPMPTAPFPPDSNPYLRLMQQAWAHARSHGATAHPVLSPSDQAVLDGSIPVEALHANGFRIVPWTTNDPDKMRQLIEHNVDGIISDRPDLLQAVMAETRANANLTATQRSRLVSFDVSAHRGGRGLRPENTLPSFESGLDNLISSIETDTGVTADRQSLIWHDQFLNPESCRRADGAAYTMENRVYIRDISMAEAQRTFICDKLHAAAFPDQRNDLALSPVAVAFAEHEHMPSPYAPTHAAQLFRFTRFYVDYYRHGGGRSQPHAAERADNAAKVRFNLETKILPERPLIDAHENKKLSPELFENHTVDPQTFVDTLTHAILSEHMESRAEIQSFDYRTLILVEEQHPQIPTYYLIDDASLLSTEFVPESLRQAAQP